MSCYQMAKRETEQLLLRPSSELVKRLDAAAEGAKRRIISRNQVALEVLERYLPLWEEVERQLDRAIEAQYDRVKGDAGGGPLVSVPVTKGNQYEAERGGDASIRENPRSSSTRRGQKR
jgi:hypothetical protein